MGERGGVPVSKLLAMGPSCGQLSVLSLSLLLVLRHYSEHRGADLSVCQVRKYLSSFYDLKHKFFVKFGFS